MDKYQKTVGDEKNKAIIAMRFFFLNECQDSLVL